MNYWILGLMIIQSIVEARLLETAKPSDSHSGVEQYDTISNGPRWVDSGPIAQTEFGREDFKQTCGSLPSGDKYGQYILAMVEHKGKNFVPLQGSSATAVCALLRINAGCVSIVGLGASNEGNEAISAIKGKYLDSKLIPDAKYVAIANSDPRLKPLFKRAPCIRKTPEIEGDGISVESTCIHLGWKEKFHEFRFGPLKDSTPENLQPDILMKSVKPIDVDEKNL